MAWHKLLRLCEVAFWVNTCLAADSFAPTSHLHGASASDTRSTLKEYLKAWRWTAFIGDSVLMSQFLSLAEELGATPTESSLSSFEPCSDPKQQGSWPTYESIVHLASEPHEYSILCNGSGCKFGRLGCMNFYKSTCAGTGAMGHFCHEECPDTIAWHDLMTSVYNLIAEEPGSFAITFHWAPTHLESENVYERLAEFVPGAILWNNCHHWFGHQPNSTLHLQPIKMDIFLGYVKNTATLLKQIMGGHTLAYQGCAKMRCNAGETWCNRGNDWLVRANAEAKTELSSMSIMFIDIQAMLSDEVIQASFLDGRHPCYPVPCMWQKNEQHPPRKCCESMMLNTLGLMQGASAGGGWDTPTFSRKKLEDSRGALTVVPPHDAASSGQLSSHHQIADLAMFNQGLRGFLDAGITPPPSKPAEAVPVDISTMMPCNIKGLETLWPWYLGAGVVFSIFIGVLVRTQLQSDGERQSLSDNRGRSAFLDNAKLGHMSLVIACHVIHTTMFGIPMDNPNFWLYGFWVWLSLFNLPLLAFISGVVSKGEPTQDRLQKLFVLVLMPYLLLKLVWWVIYMVAQQRFGMFNPLNSFAFAGIEWYLACLFMWRLLLAVFRPLWPSVLFILSLVMGLSAGYLCRQTAAFALSPMLSHWPLFIGGFLVDASSLERFLTQTVVRMCGGFLVVISLIATSFLKEQFELTLLYPGFIGDLNTDYQSYYTVQQVSQPLPVGCGEVRPWLWVYRLMRYVIVIVLGFAFLSLMPRRKIQTLDITGCGARSMYAYLLHMFVLWPIMLALQALFGPEVMSTKTTLFQGSWIWGMLVFVSPILTWFLSTRWVSFLFWPLVEPTWIETFFLAKYKKGAEQAE